MLKVKQILGDTVDVDAAGTDTGYSAILDMRFCTEGSFHYVWIGSTPTVATTVWVSNYDDPVQTNDLEWVNVSTDFTITAVTGNTGKAMLKIVASNGCYDKIRLKFVASANSASIAVFGSAKDNR